MAMMARFLTANRAEASWGSKAWRMLLWKVTSSPGNTAALLNYSLFFFLSKAYSTYSPVKHTGSPQGFSLTSGLFTSSNIAQVENNTKHAQYINVKHNPKMSPFRTALVKNGK